MAQYNKVLQDFLSSNKSLYEVNMLSNDSGSVISPTDPLPVSIHAAPFGGADVTSKNRLKISPYQIAFFNTFQFSKDDDLWDEELTTNATSIHNNNTNTIEMTATTDQGSKVVRQTKTVARYIPGRTSTLTQSIRLGDADPGYRKRIGLFDENNGFFFEVDNAAYSVVVRSSVTGSVVEQRVSRDDWNGDKLDGTGPSGIIADVTYHQLLSFEYEWYGAGQVKVGFSINGITHYIHTFNHANVISLPWSSTPFLPQRFELENLTGGQENPSRLYQGSNSIITEGTTERLGTPESYLTPLAGTGMTTANVFYPVSSLRLKSTALKGIVLPYSFQCATIDNTTLYYKIIRNATLTGGTWSDHPDPNSFTQVHTYSGDASPIGGGSNLTSGIVPTGSGSSVVFDGSTSYQIGRNTLGTVSDTFTLAVAASGSNKSAIASMNWVEQR